MDLCVEEQQPGQPFDEGVIRECNLVVVGKVEVLFEQLGHGGVPGVVSFMVNKADMPRDHLLYDVRFWHTDAGERHLSVLQGICQWYGYELASKQMDGDFEIAVWLVKTVKTAESSVDRKGVLMFCSQMVREVETIAGSFDMTGISRELVGIGKNI